MTPHTNHSVILFPNVGDMITDPDQLHASHSKHSTWSIWPAALLQDSRMANKISAANSSWKAMIVDSVVARDLCARIPFVNLIVTFLKFVLRHWQVSMDQHICTASLMILWDRAKLYWRSASSTAPCSCSRWFVEPTRSTPSRPKYIFLVESNDNPCLLNWMSPTVFGSDEQWLAFYFSWFILPKDVIATTIGKQLICCSNWPWFLYLFFAKPLSSSGNGT